MSLSIKLPDFFRTVHLTSLKAGWVSKDIPMGNLAIANPEVAKSNLKPPALILRTYRN